MSHRTYQTRLKDLPSFASQALDAYASLFCQVERTLYAQSLAQGKRPSNEQKRDFLIRYGLTGRQYNAVVYQLRGKVDSIRELNKAHIADGKNRIQKARKAIQSLETRAKRLRKTGASLITRQLLNCIKRNAASRYWSASNLSVWNRNPPAR